MHDQFLAQLQAADYVAMAIGLVLICAGRKLYWLVLGGVGFLAGLWFANQVLELETNVLGLGIAFLLGVLGAVAAIVAQKIAIAVGGFLVGGALVLYLAAPWQAQLGGMIWILALVGAIIGVLLAAMLFEGTLIVLSSLVGAGMIATATHLGQPQETWIFFILLAIGLVVQTRTRRRPVPAT